MATYKGPPNDQPVHSQNGNGILLPEPPVKDQETSNTPESSGGNKDTILAIPSHMDFKKIKIRALMEYCLQTNDSEAWEEFERKVSPTIKGVIAKRLRDWTEHGQELVKELTQEAWLKLFNHDLRVLRNFNWNGQDSIFKYVKAVAGSVVEDLRRNKHQRIIREAVSLDDPERKFSLAIRASADQKILRDQIDQCLRTLKCKDRDRSIFWLFFEHGYTAKQIANLSSINLRVRKVENILQGLLRGLRKKLDNKRGKGASPEK